MSLTQTYRVASTARGKLGMEASRGDHNLRLLVGHANLLDTLMVELASAEREQEAWFNNTIRTNSRGESAKHIQWFDNIVEESEETLDSESDSDSDSDVDTEDFPTITPRRRSVSPPPTVISFQFEDDVEDYDEDDEELTLTRVSSHTPELTHEDFDSDSEDDSMPPSPLHSILEFDEKTNTMVESSELFPKSIPHLSGPMVVNDIIPAHSVPMMISAY